MTSFLALRASVCAYLWCLIPPVKELVQQDPGQVWFTTSLGLRSPRQRPSPSRIRVGSNHSSKLITPGRVLGAPPAVERAAEEAWAEHAFGDPVLRGHRRPGHGGRRAATTPFAAGASSSTVPGRRTVDVPRLLVAASAGLCHRQGRVEAGRRGLGDVYKRQHEHEHEHDCDDQAADCRTELRFVLFSFLCSRANVLSAPMAF